MYKTLRPSCYLQFDEQLCTGCTHCVRKCPTRAIRIRDGLQVRMAGHCIACGECIVVCPTGALRAMPGKLDLDAPHQIPVAVVSPVLYSQFPWVDPRDVHRGLRALGFRYTLDISETIELFQRATQKFIRRNRADGSHPWPLISPVCPAVVRLIAYQFRSLLPNVLPFLRPTTLLAREVRKRLNRLHGIRQPGKRRVVLYHLTPNRSYLPQEQGCFDRVIGLNDVYPDLYKRISQPDQRPAAGKKRRQRPFFISADCLVWGASGGEVAGLDLDYTLHISGLSETIAYLQKLELGQFRDIAYIEFRICPGGCVGGKHTAIDKYLAKNAVLKMAGQCTAARGVPDEKVDRLYETGWFLDQAIIADASHLNHRQAGPLSLEAVQEINRLLDIFPGIDCGACGAPDCRTLAEDIVRGEAAIDDCLMYRSYLSGRARGECQPAVRGSGAEASASVALTGNRKEMVSVKVKEIVEQFDLTVAVGQNELDRPIQGGYCGDLLSDVMANSPIGCVWLTVQTHQNIVAVAVLREMAAIILTGGQSPDDETIEKAEAEGIPILLWPASSFELAGKILQAGLSSA